MTRGKKALSDMPKNQRNVINPPKFLVAVTNRVQEPKVNIISGSTRFGPYFFPRIARKGAVRT